MGSRAVVAWRECNGRNGWDHPLAIAEDMGAEMLNVIMQDGGLAKKRGGSSEVTLSAALTGHVMSMTRFTAGQDQGAMELFFSTDDTPNQINRVTSSNTRVSLTLADAIASRPQDVTWAAIGGKLYIAYDSTVNRLHVYDPSVSTSAVSVTGLKAPAAATVANTGAGTYPATIRYYKIQYRTYVGTRLVKQSNLGALVSFTPSGAGTAARVTKPAAISEGETHWVVYGAESTDGPYYDISGDIVVATTTYDDSALPSTYNTGELAPLEGAYFPFPSVKWLLTDGTRIFGLGVWETSAGDSVLPVSGRVYFSRPIGADNTDEQETIQFTVEQEDYIDLSINGVGGVDVGLGGPINGVIFAFQSRGIYMLIPTGQATAPFRRVVVTQDFGALSAQSIVSGEDERGQPCIYFLDPVHGPRRVGMGATVEWLGKDVTDLWQTINLSATSVVAWGVYDPYEKLVIWAMATGASNTPDRIIAFDVTKGRMSEDGSIRRGWLTWTGRLAQAYCGLMFPNALTSPRPLVQTMYIGYTGSNTLARQDSSTQDFGTSPYQGYITSKAFDWEPIGRTKRLMRSFLVALKVAATSVQQSLIADWGRETRTATLSVASSGAETRVRPQANTDFASLITAQVTLGDASAVASYWELDRWEAEIEVDKDAVK
jgi:hypothetical protein